MPYLPKPRHRRARALMGFGDFNDETPCTSIPAGDPYRRPGNYCATADGGYTTFNSDGSTFVQPAESRSIIDAIAGALSTVVGQRPPPPGPVLPQSGMSTTTMIALAGGAVLLTVLLTRR